MLLAESYQNYSVLIRTTACPMWHISTETHVHYWSPFLIS